MLTVLGGGFPFPLTMTSATNCMTSAISYFLTRFNRFKPTPITRSIYIKTIIPIGVCTAADIAFSNLALISLSVSFHTMLKGTIPVIVLFYSVLLKMEVLRRQHSSVLIISTGVILAAYGEIDFSWIGH